MQDDRKLQVSILDILRRRTASRQLVWKSIEVHPGGLRRYFALLDDITLLLEWPANRRCIISALRPDLVVVLDNEMCESLWFEVTQQISAVDHVEARTIPGLLWLQKKLTAH